jgi:ComF family protein
MNFISTFFNDLLHLVYPAVCAGCGHDLNTGDLICHECMSEMPTTNFYMQRNNPVEKIFWGRIPVESAMAYAYFTKDSIIQNLLHGLKYKGRSDIGILMGKLIGAQLLSWLKDEKLNGLVPLPLHPRKQKLRGYNQAHVICEGISSVTGLPIFTDVVTRRKSTETQTRKARIDRWKNMETKFEVTKPDVITNRHVLLIDDVITTGATIEACGRELLAVPGVKLSVSAFAYTSL